MILIQKWLIPRNEIKKMNGIDGLQWERPGSDEQALCQAFSCYGVSWKTYNQTPKENDMSANMMKTTPMNTDQFAFAISSNGVGAIR